MGLPHNLQSDQATFFSLMYGMEAILSIEFEVPSLCIAIEHCLDDSTFLKDRLAWLKALNERRQLAAQHVEVTQRCWKVAFDKCQKICMLLLNIWIMLQDVHKLKFLAKFDALWTSPYIIKKVFPNNSVQLKTLDDALHLIGIKHKLPPPKYLETKSCNILAK
jgi:hypothetical protein